MAELEERKYSFKVVLLGEGCVGKTSLFLRYVENKFSDKHVSTVQASYLNKRLNVGGKRVNLSIWDTAGQDRFHALGPIYYRDSNGAVLVYDITDEDSFQKVKNWVKELRRMLGREVMMCIVGNKIDLEKDRHVTVQEAEAFAASVNARHYHSSAKLNRGVDELFLDLIKGMIEKSEGTLSRGQSLPRGRNRHNVVVVVDDEQKQPQTKSGSCC